jgi:DNA-binding GntR family transcriptional regulator
MTRHQALELLITRRIPDDVAAIEATLRAIAARVDAVDGADEYDDVHHRLDELLTARERARTSAPSRSVLV